MRRSSKRLSDDFVTKKLKPGTSDKKVWDADQPGFGVRVTKKGVKSWIVQFDRNGKKVSATLGGIKEMDTEAARAKAKRLRDLHKEGVDILAHLQEKMASPDVTKAVQVWEKDYSHLLKPSTAASYRSIINTGIIPHLGHRLIKDISLQDVKTFHSALSENTPIQANRAVVVLSRLFTIAHNEEWMEDRNPCRQFKRAKERPKKRKFTNAELARLERALLSLVSEGQLDEVVADLVRFLAFSAQRIGEAINLTWDSIDERRNLMGVDNHKTDDGGTVEKILPLNTHLKAVLKRRKAVMQGPLVFPSSVTGGPIKGIPKCWSRILERANIGLHKGERATPHDFRRTFRSHCGELGYPDSVGETFLGHGLGKVQGTYLHYGPHGLLGKAYQATADMIAAAMAGKNPKPGVPIQKKGNKKPSPAKSLPPEKA